MTSTIMHPCLDAFSIFGAGNISWSIILTNRARLFIFSICSIIMLITHYMFASSINYNGIYQPGLIYIRQSLMFHNKHRGRSTVLIWSETLFISSGTLLRAQQTPGNNIIIDRLTFQMCLAQLYT